MKEKASTLLLALIYFVVFVPWAMLFRLFNPDHLRLRTASATGLEDRVVEFDESSFQHPF